MNELEEQNLHEHIVRKSVAVLILEGGIAWILMALIDYGFDSLPVFLQGTAGNNFNTALLNPAALTAAQPLFHLTFNILYGWLIFYVILSWVFEYYIIKSDSIIIHRGIIFSREDVFQIEDVKTVEVIQGFWGKLFRLGTIHFYAFRANKHVYLNHISSPEMIAAHLHSLHPAPETVRLGTRTRR